MIDHQLKSQQFHLIDQIDQRLRRVEALTEMLFGYAAHPLDETKPETVTEALLAIMPELDAMRASHDQLLTLHKTLFMVDSTPSKVRKVA